jgi:hypothetical protein
MANKNASQANRNASEMRTGEVAQQARKSGVKGVEQMNKEQMLQAMGQSPPESARSGQGGGKGDRPAPKGTDPSQWKNIPGNQS